MFQEALRRKVRDLVQFLLYKYRSKELTTKAEMLAMVIRDYMGYYPVIFKEVSDNLTLIFGINMVEVDHLVHSYALVRALGITYDGLLHGVQGMPKTGLLIIMLGIIYLKGEHVREEAIWEVLSMMRIYPEQNHCVTGNPRMLFTEIFVQEGYLEYREIPYTNPVQHEFLWGPRAFAETSRERILEFLAKITGLL
ncbi:melanoma-associated antigen 4-like [Nannospalax galili]|uniref:melanoma-associated antigen 4-like n=1 Tax=Nannospalax galili TaxID=1026970 RepID=UPI0004ED44A2|nr:melanoma-associated antigen 4-like [Nannospalax galili]